jgi:hypothetical protein
MAVTTKHPTQIFDESRECNLCDQGLIETTWLTDSGADSTSTDIVPTSPDVFHSFPPLSGAVSVDLRWQLRCCCNHYRQHNSWRASVHTWRPWVMYDPLLSASSQDEKTGDRRGMENEYRDVVGLDRSLLDVERQALPSNWI